MNKELTWKNFPVIFKNRMKEFKVNSKVNTLISIDKAINIIEDLSECHDRRTYDFSVNVKLYGNKQSMASYEFPDFLEKIVKRDCMENSDISRVIDYLNNEHFQNLDNFLSNEWYYWIENECEYLSNDYMSLCALEKVSEDKTNNLLYRAISLVSSKGFAGRSGGHFVADFNHAIMDDLENAKYELTEENEPLREVIDRYQLKTEFENVTLLDMLSQWIKEMSKGLDFFDYLENELTDKLLYDDEYKNLCKETFQLELKF